MPESLVIPIRRGNGKNLLPIFRGATDCSRDWECVPKLRSVDTSMKKTNILGLATTSLARALLALFLAVRRC